MHLRSVTFRSGTGPRATRHPSKSGFLPPLAQALHALPYLRFQGVLCGQRKARQVGQIIVFSRYNNRVFSMIHPSQLMAPHLSRHCHVTCAKRVGPENLHAFSLPISSAARLAHPLLVECEAGGARSVTRSWSAASPPSNILLGRLVDGLVALRLVEVEDEEAAEAELGHEVCDGDEAHLPEKKRNQPSSTVPLVESTQKVSR